MTHRLTPIDEQRAIEAFNWSCLPTMDEIEWALPATWERDYTGRGWYRTLTLEELKQKVGVKVNG